ncbi:MAG: hypothetical protein ACFFBS_05670 [Promethearchaeota archaeon]
MKRVSLAVLAATIGFLIGGAFSYFYEARWMGELPIINYPFRYLALPFFAVGIILAVTTVVLEMSSRVK